MSIVNSDASIQLDWGDGNYKFRLPWGQLIELQEKLDAGPSFIMESMWNNSWKIEYISNIIRLGLIGGGQTPSDALRLTRTYVEARPPMENLSVAQAILAIALTGGENEEGE